MSTVITVNGNFVHVTQKNMGKVAGEVLSLAWDENSPDLTLKENIILGIEAVEEILKSLKEEERSKHPKDQKMKKLSLLESRFGYAKKELILLDRTMLERRFFSLILSIEGLSASQSGRMQRAFISAEQKNKEQKEIDATGRLGDHFFGK